MKRFGMFLRILTFGFLIASLSGCTFFNFIKNMFTGAKEKIIEKKKEILSQKSTPDVALLSIDGKPSLTKKEFDVLLSQIIKANPYFQTVGGVAGLPGEIKRKIFDRIVEQRLIVASTEKKGIDKQEDFVESLSKTTELLRQSLLVQFYEKDILSGITVDQNEVKAEFEKNKSRYIKVAGGALVEGVKFENSSDADAFYDRVKSNISNFTELAKNEPKGEFKNFDRVGESPYGPQYSQISPAIRSAVLKLSTYPSIIKVKDVNKKTWVVHAADKKETVYFSLDEIRPRLESMIKTNKFKEKLDTQLKTLRKEFTVDINEDFFAKNYMKTAEEKKVAKVSQVA